MNDLLDRLLAERDRGPYVQRANRRFDEFIGLEPEVLARVVQALQVEFDASRQVGRRRDDQRNWERVFGAVVANVLVAALAETIHYPRANSAYQGRSPYWPDWMSIKQLRNTIDRADELRWLYKQDAPAQPEGGYRSNFFGLPAFRERLDSLGVTPESVVKDYERAPVLFLRPGDHEGPAVAEPLVGYDASSPAIVAMATEVRAYNAFLRKQGITVLGWDTMIPRPDLTSASMHRVFNRSSWELGGRYYGGFWISMPGENRNRIRINGEETAELDFSAFNLRALYDLAGASYSGDPYAIPAVMAAVEQAGWDWATRGRSLVKKASLRAVNGANIRYQTKLDCPPTMTLTQLGRAILAFHAPIAGQFSPVCGLELMRLDSRIAEDVLREALAAEIPVLPIHDGFRTVASQVEWLRGVMSESYLRHVGFSPVIT